MASKKQTRQTTGSRLQAAGNRYFLFSLFYFILFLEDYSITNQAQGQVPQSGACNPQFCRITRFTNFILFHIEKEKIYSF